MQKIQLPNQDLVVRSLHKTLLNHQGKNIGSADIIQLLADHGMDIFVTGGSPRDWLTGSVSGDIDISITGPIAEARNILIQAYPSKEAFLWYYEDFGLIGWGDSESAHIDINILRDFRDAETFLPQSDFAHDYQTRDFSINCLYYSIQDQVVYDPTGRAFADLQKKLLRVNAHETTYTTNHSLSYRIAKFMLKDYSLDDSCHSYLRQFMAKDLQQFTDQEFNSFLSGQILSKGLSGEAFRANLLELSKQHGCLDVIQHRSVFFEI